MQTTGGESGVIQGKYRHFKGGIYDVLGVATHTETSQKLVIYKGPNGKMFARPQRMFEGYKMVDGKLVKRFEKVEDEE
jgi:hypothetical protein